MSYASRSGSSPRERKYSSKTGAVAAPSRTLPSSTRASQSSAPAGTIFCGSMEEVYGSTVAPVEAIRPAYSSVAAYVTRCPRRTSSSTTPRVGVRWPVAGMLKKAM
ncbi:hypothetical protein ACIO3O_18820 [Streptomyces sp. NPDC087440]|uniref:hypothetical protein n=1 Tax=Streptomyces sp. NPDC087440 TaxID=3365790 RepID=UPI003818310E